MVIYRALTCALASVSLLASLGLAPTPKYSIPSVDRARESAIWKDLGLRLPEGGIVREYPYDEPYDNRSFVVPSSWYAAFYRKLRAHEDIRVAADDLRADLPELRFILQKAYSGYDTAARRGWDWNEMFRRWDSRLVAKRGTMMSLEDAFAPWGELERMQLDNHSGVPGLRAFVSGSMSSMLDERPVLPCASIEFEHRRSVALLPKDAGQQPHAVYQWNGSLSRAWYVSYPARLGPATAIECANGTISVHAIPTPRLAAGTPSFKELAPGVGYLRMPTFTDANDDALRSLVAATPQLQRERAVVFDLRDNDGGNAPLDLLSHFASEAALTKASEQARQIGTQSCFRTALFFGLQQQLLGQITKPISQELAQQLQSLVDSLGGRSTPNCAVQPLVTNGSRSLSEHRLALTWDRHSPRVIALIDGGCGSDCEYMTYVIAGLPGSVIVGSSSYGVMGFTQPGYTVLPHSRIPFRLALSRTDEYGDGRSVDGYGITVDILLGSEAAQSESSLRDLAKALLARR